MEGREGGRIKKYEELGRMSQTVCVCVRARSHARVSVSNIICVHL